MSLTKRYTMIVIGGSAGSLSTIIELLKSLPKNFTATVVVVIHRQRNGASELDKILSTATGRNSISEPDDKEKVLGGRIYLAPQNYHLLFEDYGAFSLDYSEAVKYSRPSIDVTFESAAGVYKERLLAILLSGANSDGCEGVEKTIMMGGTAIVQDPATAQYPAMPAAAVSIKGVKTMTPNDIQQYLNSFA